MTMPEALNETEIDAIVRDPRLAPYCGWHEEYNAWCKA